MLKIGKQSYIYKEKVTIEAAISVAGSTEKKGPLGKKIDYVMDDIWMGKDTWEEAEAALMKKGISKLLEKAILTEDEIDLVLGGDLINQSTPSTFAMREFRIPFMGIFAACAVFGEGLFLGASLLQKNAMKRIIVSATSHFCSAEKQFRQPLEYATLRPPTASWTVTGNGSVLLTLDGKGPIITKATLGKVIDLGIKDPANMGAAMAPAAADTILTHLDDFSIEIDHYDAIVTGDLGRIGKKILIDLLKKEIPIGNEEIFFDCGEEIYDAERQGTHNGGSGCACPAIGFIAKFYPKLLMGTDEKILFLPTGALFSPLTIQQGESMPCISHGIVVASNTKPS